MGSDGQPPQRLRHSAFLVFLLGGTLGSGLNLAVSAVLHDLAGVNPYASFFAGTLANLLFHHVYYALIFVNQERRMRAAWPVRLLLYAAVAGASALLLAVPLELLGLDFAPAVACTIVVLSLLNALLIRITTFSSAQLAEIEYRDMNETFYDDQTDRAKVGWFRAWFHRSRYERLTRFVSEYYRPGMVIADLGCGNCWWNVHGLPVTGVDVNEKMLSWARRHRRLADYRVCADLARTGLPDRHFDLIVMSETLEHLLDLPGVLAEVRRILKDDGVFLITVPYDVFLGPFFILFNVNCVYQGYVKGSVYHRYRCGHVHHFSIGRLRKTLAAGGFGVDRRFIVNGLTLYAAAGKRSAAAPRVTGPGSPAGPPSPAG